MAQFQTKGALVDAIQWIGSAFSSPAPTWLPDALKVIDQGTLKAGDWVIADPGGTFRVCPAEQFAAAFKAAGKRDLKKAETRAHLVGCAAKLFARKGYDAVNMRELAHAAGYSTGSIFSHFAGKAELYEAATGQSAPDIAGFLRQLIMADPYMPVGNVQEQAGALRAQLFGADA